MRIARPPQVLILALWLLALCVVIAGLILLDRPTGGEPGPLAFAIVRIAGLASAAYLLMTTLAALGPRAWQQRPAARRLAGATLPAVRRLAGRSAGLGISASLMVGLTPTTAGPVDTTTPAGPPRPRADEPVVMVLVETPPSPPERKGPPATMHLLGSDEPTGEVTTSLAAAVLDAPPADPPAALPLHTVPPSPAPAPSTPHAADNTPEVPIESWTIQPGDHLWAVASETLGDRWGRAPSDRETVGYLRVLIESNRHRLADPNNPDLVFPGQVVQLPPTPPG